MYTALAATPLRASEANVKPKPSAAQKKSQQEFKGGKKGGKK
jgi:hypothetical protein